MSQRSGWTVAAGFGAMCLGMFMAILDIQIVATSIPTIQAKLAISPDSISWIQTAYLMAEIISIPLTGHLTRLLGMRRLFTFAVVAFTVASGGCAASSSFAELVSWRVLQGFAGGTLIPSVFSAVFLLFPPRHQGHATTAAGVLAVLAPTIGPIAGGWITGTYSWHWLFLVNVLPGILSTIGGIAFLSSDGKDASGSRLDLVALFFLASGLSALVLALKDAPQKGWMSLPVIALLVWTLIASSGLVIRSRSRASPLVDVSLFANREFAVGSALSFVLGIGLFGSVYLMPVFLAFVRGHDAFEIGQIMLVTGLAQLLSAPVAVEMERRVDSRWLTAFGFLLFAAGLGWSAFQTMDTDASEMFWPQILRGSAIMFCLLPPTRLALGSLPEYRVPDASALFNLMRNLGGAIGLALIDTIIYGRAPAHGLSIAARAESGDLSTLESLGLPAFLSDSDNIEIGQRALRSLMEPKIAKLALVETINVAWAVVFCLTLLALLTLPLARRGKTIRRA